MSDRRCAWASRWCREAALASTIQVKNFREAVGRLAFSAGPLVFLRPFLGPLYSWGAVVADESRAEMPPMVLFVLVWLADQFAKKERIPYGRHTTESTICRFLSCSATSIKTRKSGNFVVPNFSSVNPLL